MVLQAAMAAPSAGNKQPWQFIVVTERLTLNTLADKLQYAKMLKDAPAAIIVCGDTTRAFDGIEAEFWIQDCSATSQNILLAVEALGLGAVWTGIYPMPDRVTAVQEILNLPNTVIPLSVIPIGHPDGPQNPKHNWNPGLIRWD